jgi:hypothetical protein
MAHPYEALKETDLWVIIGGAIEDLVSNQDILENTPREYIVGYLVKKLVEAEGKAKKT